MFFLVLLKNTPKIFPGRFAAGISQKKVPKKISGRFAAVFSQKKVQNIPKKSRRFAPNFPKLIFFLGKFSQKKTLQHCLVVCTLEVLVSIQLPTNKHCCSVPKCTNIKTEQFGTLQHCLFVGTLEVLVSIHLPTNKHCL